MARKRSAAVDVDLDELEALDELDELEDDEPVAKPKRTRSTRKAKPAPEPEDDGDEDEDDEDDEDDEPVAKPRRGRPRKSSSDEEPKKKGRGGNFGPRELPKGKLGVNDLAEAADKSARDVRAWLRRNEVEKDEETNRYMWNKTELAKLVKAMKRSEG